MATGACANLRKDDNITSTHRGHGHLISKGGDLKLMMAELFGRRTGYCKGKGRSMHIADVEIGILGANGIVGGGFPIAVSAGFMVNYKGTDQVAAYSIPGVVVDGSDVLTVYEAVQGAVKRARAGEGLTLIECKT